MSKIKLEVRKPEGQVVKAEFDQVIVPGIEGDFGVLPGHTPFITRLRPGILTCIDNTVETRWAIHDGFVTVEADMVLIACEIAEKSDDIDAERAREAHKRAEKRLRVKQDDTDFRRAEMALHRAVARLGSLKSDSEL
ncbi:MAG: F0F1 ATP synthase subunit epsilon [Candidatus Cloacimonetes bacterium]|nr:F0F1 ATP synthase subunit epsilon [Candidatus Cloacimonadota bacterium]